jgi:Arm DNA-binding domain
MTKRLALTETAIAKAVKIARATEQRARLPDPGMRGLWLAIGATGATRWEARVRVAADGSAPRWIGLGDYPDIGLAVGRTRCEAVRVAARAGTDLAGLRSMCGTTRAAPVPTLPPPLAWQTIARLHHAMPGGAPPDALVFATDAGHALGNWDRVTKTLHALSGTADWNRHDLRRTAATLLGELGTDPHVIESVLGHVTPHTGLASIYNRARYRPEMTVALQRLADLLDELEYGKAGTNALGLAA